MRYVGNYAKWISPDIIAYLIDNDGTKRPGGGENPESPEFTMAAEVGYDLTKTYWHHYDEKSTSLQISPPIPTDKKVLWWFIKMIPGQFMPMHRDPHITETWFTNCTRYWMPLQDYSPGHVFIYNNVLMTDYKAGDLWQYTDANEIHGACNIGYSTRLTFQFTTYDTN